MAKRIITISRIRKWWTLLSEKKLQKNLELLIMTKILSMRLQKSLVYHKEYIQENAELSPKRLVCTYAFVGRDIIGKSVEDMVYEAQRKVIFRSGRERVLCDHWKKCGLYPERP